MGNFFIRKKKALFILGCILAIAIGGIAAVNLLTANAEEPFNFADIETLCYQMTTRVFR